MDDQIYVNKVSKIFAENRLLKFVVVIIGIVTLYNAHVAQKALHSQKTVLVPLSLSEETTIDGNNLPDDYLEKTTRYVMGLAANYTPVTARGNFDRLLKLFRPDEFTVASKKFYDLASAVEISKSTTAFFITKISVERKKSEIEVIGTRKQFSESSLIPDNGAARTYYIDYAVENGRFMITNITEKAD